MADLSHRLEKTVLAKFKGNKRKAIAYLRSKCSFYAHKSDATKKLDHPAGLAFFNNWQHSP